MNPPADPPVTLCSLWRQFLPLSVSDVTMAAGDPLTTTTLTHLPDARENLAAVGVAKSLAVFLESPVIMMLHASTALSATAASRRALWRFMLALCGFLTLALLLLTTPPAFGWIAAHGIGLDPVLAERSRAVLALMVLWPAVIGWRRYFQGRLIRAGKGAAVGRAGVARLGFVALCLAAGYALGVAGWRLAGLSLVGGVLLEALWVTLAARSLAADEVEHPTATPLPTDLGGVWRYYAPLMASMLVVWGGRAALVAIVARAVDGPVALAVWPAGWGLILLVANATRMVQQLIIRHRGSAPDGLLLTFALSVGLACTAVLMAVVATPLGAPVVAAFVGEDRLLVEGMMPVLAVGAVAPLMVAMQNAMQGFLISSGRTARINAATCFGTAILLVGAGSGVALGGSGGATAASAMIVALLAETAFLALAIRAPRSAG